MNAPAPHNQFQQARAANIARMAKAAAAWAKFPASDWAEYEFLDALGFAIDADLSSEMADLRHELRIDADGFPLNGDGDRPHHAVRRYVPLTSLGRDVAEKAA